MDWDESQREPIEQESGDHRESRHRNHSTRHRETEVDHRRKRDDSSPLSDDDRKRKRRKKSRREDSDRAKSRKSEKKKKEKKKKSKKKKIDETKKRKSDKTASNPKFHVEMGKVLGKAPDRLLDPNNDYFSFHKHLWLYLYREEGLAFNDMTSEDTREAFNRFVRRYNRGDLPEGYYDPNGIPLDALEQAKTTRHQWSFQTSEIDQQKLHSVEAGVWKNTETDIDKDNYSRDQNNSAIPPRDSSKPLEFNDAESPVTKSPNYAANRRMREHVRTAEEEFGGGKKDGREREIQKKKELAEKIHGASKDRGETGLELGDDVIYGADAADFLKSALAREQKRAAEKKNKQASRLVELEAKEKSKQEEMLKILGLTGIKPGQKITIAPRNDEPTHP